MIPKKWGQIRRSWWLSNWLELSFKLCEYFILASWEGILTLILILKKIEIILCRISSSKKWVPYKIFNILISIRKKVEKPFNRKFVLKKLIENMNVYFQTSITLPFKILVVSIWKIHRL